MYYNLLTQFLLFKFCFNVSCRFLILKIIEPKTWMSVVGTICVNITEPLVFLLF